MLKGVRSEILRLTFGSGNPVTPGALGEHLGPLGRFFDSGILKRRSDGLVETTLQYEFFRDLLLASDRRDRPYQLDHVLGMTWSTRIAAACIPRRDVSNALDMGCGNGVLALTMAEHASSVLAVDLNGRAIAATRMNAVLNGIENVEYRRSDLFGALDGEEFDLIVANPPYVISPYSDFLFRDSGLPGDDVSRQCVMGAGASLAVGGVAVVLVEWLDGPTRSWDAPRRWIAETGCSGWVLSYANKRAGEYVDQWMEVPQVPPNEAELRSGWSEYLGLLGAESVTSGIIVLERQAEGASSVHATDFVPDHGNQISTQLMRGLAGQRLLRSGSLGAVMKRTLELAADTSWRGPAELATPLGVVRLSEPEIVVTALLEAGYTIGDATEASGYPIDTLAPLLMRLIRSGVLVVRP